MVGKVWYSGKQEFVVWLFFQMRNSWSYCGFFFKVLEICFCLLDYSFKDFMIFLNMLLLGNNMGEL